MVFRLRFPSRDIAKWAARYGYSDGDADPLRVAAAPRKRGYLTKPEFLALTKWKTVRTQRRCASNSAQFIRAVTEASLSSPNEQLRIEILTILSGVRWPTASVILHFCSRDPYPILDDRALWSLSCPASDRDYNFELWAAYCEYTRRLAGRLKISMRVLDRALWQYSKERQPAKP